MAFEVLCLRPEADFARVDALPPASLQVTYGKPDDPALPQRMQAAAALVIPAVGPKLAATLFEGCSLRLRHTDGLGELQGGSDDNLHGASEQFGQRCAVGQSGR